MTKASTTKVDRETAVLYTIVESPLGRILVAGRERGIALVSFLDGKNPAAIGSGWTESRRTFREAALQLTAYFRRELTRFDLELDLRGTDFQREVWRELMRVPYGRTASYAEIAAAVGRPTAVRAVGAANGANRLPLFIPCHRIIGSDGRLTGYRGGIEIKHALLELESRTAGRARAS